MGTIEPDSYGIAFSPKKFSFRSPYFGGTSGGACRVYSDGVVSGSGSNVGWDSCGRSSPNFDSEYHTSACQIRTGGNVDNDWIGNSYGKIISPNLLSDNFSCCIYIDGGVADIGKGGGVTYSYGLTLRV